MSDDTGCVARRRLRRYLDGHGSVYRVTDGVTVDFRLFDAGAWPDPLNDDHLMVTRRSSVHVEATADERGAVAEATLHLPPIDDAFEADLRRELALPGPWAVLFGSTQTAGETSVYDGVATPHVYTRAETTVDATRRVVESCVEAYGRVYDHGEQTVKRLP